MDTIAQHEREKYEKVWQHDDYRKTSPGEREVERAIRMCAMIPGELVTDFGSGTGRATKMFAEKGFETIAVDHVANANDAAPILIEACLWDLPDNLPKAEWGFCCDVMEHIPEDKVDATLASIAWKTHKGAWFRICTVPDGFGPKLVGEPLHLTIKDASWWRDALEKHWMTVSLIETTPSICVFAVKN